MTSYKNTDEFGSTQIKSRIKSALEIIQESLPPEDAAKFHSHSRAPFDYEQPVIDAAKEAMGGREFKKPSKTPARLSVPSWLYENAPVILKRVYDVEVFLADLRFGTKQPLRVSVTKELFDTIVADECVKSKFSFYTATNAGVAIEETEKGLSSKRWIRLCNTLFVEE